jgi:hypothetical protein
MTTPPGSPALITHPENSNIEIGGITQTNGTGCQTAGGHGSRDPMKQIAGQQGNE